MDSSVSSHVAHLLVWKQHLNPPIELYVVDEVGDRFKVAHFCRQKDGAPINKNYYQDDVAMWSTAFDGGLQLAQYILSNPQEFAGKTVADLGSGAGIVAIAAKKAGAARVIAIDSSRDAIKAIQINAKRNDAEIETVRMNILEVGREIALGRLDVDLSDIDIITAADVFHGGDYHGGAMYQAMTHLAAIGKTVYATSQDLQLDELKVDPTPTSHRESDLGDRGVIALMDKMKTALRDKEKIREIERMQAHIKRRLAREDAQRDAAVIDSNAVDCEVLPSGRVRSFVKLSPKTLPGRPHDQDVKTKPARKARNG